MNRDFFTNLPSEIIIDILSRLPIRTIISCKCVCKSWLVLVETPEFVESHLSKSIPGLALLYMEPTICTVFEFEDGLDLRHHDLHYIPVTEFHFPHDASLIQGSANGLLMLRGLYRFMPDGLFICNPVTREYIELQCTKDFDYVYPQVVTFGFGASKITGQHKVVRIFHDCILDYETQALIRIPKSECRVYTLGTGSWRHIAPGATLQYSVRTIGAFLNGNLHWLVHDLEGFPLISCFDLETELFSTFACPPFPSTGRVLRRLSVLGDCLCLCETFDDEIVIWLMKEYGVEKSWTKEYVISKIPDYAGESYDVVCPIKVFKDGDILMAWQDYFFFYYSSKTKTIRTIDTFEARADSILHTSSFLSLKSFGVEDVRSF